MGKEMTTLYLPTSKKKAWRKAVEEDRRARMLRPTAVCFDVFRTPDGVWVPLVATGGTLRRRDKTGHPALGLPKGGIDSVDRCCVVRAACRESTEETGIRAKRRFVQLLVGPWFCELECPLDRMSMVAEKHYLFAYKAFYSVHVETCRKKLPRHKLQEGEIHELVWVRSFVEFKKNVCGGAHEEFLLETARRANVWEDTE